MWPHEGVFISPKKNNPYFRGGWCRLMSPGDGKLLENTEVMQVEMLGLDSMILPQHKIW